MYTQRGGAGGVGCWRFRRDERGARRCCGRGGARPSSPPTGRAARAPSRVGSAPRCNGGLCIRSYRWGVVRWHGRHCEGGSGPAWWRACVHEGGRRRLSSGAPWPGLPAWIGMRSGVACLLLVGGFGAARRPAGRHSGARAPWPKSPAAAHPEPPAAVPGSVCGRAPRRAIQEWVRCAVALAGLPPTAAMGDGRSRWAPHMADRRCAAVNYQPDLDRRGFVFPASACHWSRPASCAALFPQFR